jgi:DNA-directed RNA polymerase subunit RPC12/RpoP
VKIGWRESEYPCRNCGRDFPGTRLDRRMWCPDCRKEVIRRATTIARLAGLVAALGLAAWIFTMLGPSPRFLVVYLVMIVAAYFFLYKMTQRVAFEIIRGRGVPPPPEARTGTDDGRTET